MDAGHVYAARQHSNKVRERILHKKRRYGTAVFLFILVKDLALVRRPGRVDDLLKGNAEMFKELRQAWPALGRCVQQKEALHDSLTAERQKVREQADEIAVLRKQLEAR